MLRLRCFLPLLLSIHALCLRAEKLDLKVEAESAILMNADSGAILFEKDPHALHYPASITKIATALYTLEKAEHLFDEMLTADQDSIGTVKEEVLRRSNYTLPAYTLIPDGSHIGIKRGEILSLKDLMYGMMLASGDDAANVIAKFVGGTIPQFMEGVNQLIKEIGCTSTCFYNPHGLHHPKQHTTAYDMALLTRRALKNPTFRQIVSTTRYTRPKTNKQEASPLVQGNKLLRPGPLYYPKAIGVKTGYYSLAANTLVAAAVDGDRTLIAVLLKVKNRKDMFADAAKMFETAFKQVRVERVLMRQGTQKFALNLPGTRKSIPAYLKEDISISYYPAEESQISCFLQWDKGLTAPIAMHQRIGELRFTLENGQLWHIVPLFAAENFDLSKWQKLKNGWSDISGILKAVGALAVAALILWRITVRKIA
jgi:serine-type D-Ala-D-Ala carboxypeptidase (penicillin-binding protein 5/6)